MTCVNCTNKTSNVAAKFTRLITNVSKGVYNNVKPNPIIDNIAKKRFEVCLTCEFLANNMFVTSVLMCSDCNCFLDIKLKVEENLCTKWKDIR